MKKLLFYLLALLTFWGCKDHNPPSDILEIKMVDLGLSVKWANMNVGASKPDECGDYFAWGEIVPKEDYSEATYELCSGSIFSLIKYTTSSAWGLADNKIVLELSDDAAYMNLNGHGRMPTREEWNELQTNCKWTWIQTKNGGQGYKVTGRNGNSIFLPAAGFRMGKNKYSVGEYARYWSSMIDARSPESAYMLLFGNLKGNAFHRESADTREDGYSVRAVSE